VEDMHYLALIQARCGSTRLPDKVMKNICGKPDLQWVIERVQRADKVDEVMVVTSIEKNNLPIVRLCADMGVRVYVGSEEDVLDRYYQAAKLVKPDYVIRITADCPLFDWNYLDEAIDMMDGETDFLWQADEDFPDGLDLEIMTYEALEKSWKESRLLSEREHVTQYMRKHPELFRIKNYRCPIPDISHLRWTLDEEEDYEVIQRIYKHFIEAGRENFNTGDILEYLCVHPEISEINAKYSRNEGLAKSLRNDRIIDNGV
jgi:spore coat polysaccharide biosynthesis protein SpsF